MKMKRISKEVDLYVDSKKMTEKEMQEMSHFIEEYKRKFPIKNTKHRKTA